MPQSKLLGNPLTVDGDTFRRAFDAATGCLERYRDDINSLNVFPVPDGDTGTNMVLTMRSGNDEASQIKSSSVGEIARAIAHGALLGARGNSGVILSQFLTGMAVAAKGIESLDAKDIARSLILASQTAYTAVSKPVEGTMLTVMRELGIAAQESVDSGTTEVVAVLQAATQRAKMALANTPTQLPVLKEAGVVDAGGQGITLLLEAITAYFAGEPVESQNFDIFTPAGMESTAPTSIHQDFLDTIEGEDYGYCIQLLLRGDNLNISAIREKLLTIADSTMAVGDESLAKIHVHALDPGPVLTYATSLGSINQVEIENMEEQRQEFVAYHRGQQKSVPVAVVAVASGEGFVELYRTLGCQIVVNGGQGMNPSTKDLVEAARRSAAEDVILLTNNPNVILAANQAGSLFGSGLHVVPSRTIPQGIAAMLAYNEEDPLQSNLHAMEEALGSVQTIQITTAVRSSTVGGLKILKGQNIALAEEKIVAVGNSPWSVIQDALTKTEVSTGAHLDVFWGGNADKRDARNIADCLEPAFPGEVEVHHGGQPFYEYILSVTE